MFSQKKEILNYIIQKQSSTFRIDLLYNFELYNYFAKYTMHYAI